MRVHTLLFHIIPDRREAVEETCQRAFDCGTTLQFFLCFFKCKCCVPSSSQQRQPFHDLHRVPQLIKRVLILACVLTPARNFSPFHHIFQWFTLSQRWFFTNSSYCTSKFYIFPVAPVLSSHNIRYDNKEGNDLIMHLVQIQDVVMENRWGDAVSSSQIKTLKKCDFDPETSTKKPGSSVGGTATVELNIKYSLVCIFMGNFYTRPPSPQSCCIMSE